MSDNLDVGEDRAYAEHMVARALKALDTATDTLEDACDAMKAAGAASGEDEVVRRITALNKAFVFAMLMEDKAHAAGSERFGIHGAGTLDLDAARDEIGLRLARLRAAGDSGSVSERVE